MLCLAAGLLASSLARERNTAFLLAYVFAAIFLLFFSQLFMFVLIVGWSGNRRPERDRLVDMDCGSHESFSSGLMDSQGIGGWSSLFSCILCPRQTLEVALLDRPAGRAADFLCGRPLRGVADQTFLAGQSSLRPAREPAAAILHAVVPPPLSRARCSARWTATPSPGCNSIPGKRAWANGASAWLLSWSNARPRNADQSVRESAATGLLLILAGVYTFVGVSGFLEEKRSGALELILVTPISVNKLIFGRVWGLWKQFLPAALILAAFILYNESSSPRQNDAAVEFSLVCGFFTLPVFATYFALRVKNLIVAAVLTWIALWLPFAFAMAEAPGVHIRRTCRDGHYAHGLFAQLRGLRAAGLFPLAA